MLSRAAEALMYLEGSAAPYKKSNNACHRVLTHVHGCAMDNIAWRVAPTTRRQLIPSGGCAAHRIARRRQAILHWQAARVVQSPKISNPGMDLLKDDDDESVSVFYCYIYRVTVSQRDPQGPAHTRSTCSPMIISLLTSQIRIAGYLACHIARVRATIQDIHLWKFE